MSEIPLDPLDNLSLNKAAGSGIPEIKTILSGAHPSTCSCIDFIFTPTHRLRDSWISWWAHAVHEVTWFGTLGWFGPIARLVLCCCSPVASSLTCCQERKGLLFTLRAVLVILSVDFTPNTKTMKVSLLFVGMGHVSMIILNSEAA